MHRRAPSWLEAVDDGASRVAQQVPVLVDVGDASEAHRWGGGHDAVCGADSGYEHGAFAGPRTVLPWGESDRHIHVVSPFRHVDDLLAEVGGQVMCQGLIPELQS